MAKFYMGYIRVEGNDFQLYAERVIPRLKKDEIAFSFSGIDESGKFSIDGTAHLNEHGFYMASKQKLVYADSNIAETPDTASIRIDYVRRSRKRDCLEFKGRWIQNGLNWKLKAILGSNSSKNIPKSRLIHGDSQHTPIRSFDDFHLDDIVRFVPYRRNAHYGILLRKLTSGILVVKEFGSIGKQWRITPSQVTTLWSSWNMRKTDKVYKCGCQVTLFSRKEHTEALHGTIKRCPECKKIFKIIE